MCAKHYIPVSSVPLFPITIPPPPSSPLFPYTTLFRSRPVQRRASREMPAAPDQRDAIVQRPRLILPELDRRVQPRDPLPIRRVQQDRRVERVTPLHHRAVEVRMRDSDNCDATERPHGCNGIVVNERRRIPQHVATRRTHEQRALPDREMRPRTDSDQTRLLLADLVPAFLPQLLQRRPLLSLPADVLPLVETDETRRRRRIAVRVLRATRDADRAQCASPAHPKAARIRRCNIAAPRVVAPPRSPAAARQVVYSRACPFLLTLGRMSTYENILETIGNTPVVRIGRLAPPDVALFVKIEAF